MLRVIPTEALPQIDRAVFAETRDRLAGGRIERVQVVHDTGQEPLLLAVGPESHPALRAAAADSRVEFPEQFARGSVERDHLESRRVGIQRAAAHGRIGLWTTDLVSVQAP